jgi:hypothetical protein
MNPTWYMWENNALRRTRCRWSKVFLRSILHCQSLSSDRGREHLPRDETEPAAKRRRAR